MQRTLARLELRLLVMVDTYEFEGLMTSPTHDWRLYLAQRLQVHMDLASLMALTETERKRMMRPSPRSLAASVLARRSLERMRTYFRFPTPAPVPRAAASGRTRRPRCTEFLRRGRRPSQAFGGRGHRAFLLAFDEETPGYAGRWSAIMPTMT